MYCLDPSTDAANLGSSLPSNFDVVPSNDQGNYVAEEPTSQTWPSHLWDGYEVPSNFVGREDTFAAIDDWFFPQVPPAGPQDQVLPCCCISGLGGMGKTRTAVQYAKTRKDRFDGIFIVQADNAPKLSEAFCKISPTLGLDNGEEQPSEEEALTVNKHRVLKWLAAPKFSASASDKRLVSKGTATADEPNWLIIFDNVENAGILGDYWPMSNVGCVLVTTRDDKHSNYLRSRSRMTHLCLDALPTSYASKLLLQLSFIEAKADNITAASAIVEKLGGVPLAIEHVAAYIDTNRMTLDEFLTFYDKTMLESQKNDANSSSWSHLMATSWALDGLSPAAASLIRVYSFGDPDGMEDSVLLKHSIKSLPKDFPADETHFSARADLLKGSLIRADTNTTPILIRMHRLVQDVVLARTTPTQYVQAFAFVVASIMEAWSFTKNKWDHQAEVWPTHETLLPHIFRLAEIASVHGHGGLTLTSKRDFTTLLSKGGW
jgi:hypothetical protein